MEELAEKKTARTQQKRKVTKCINKLKSSLLYCPDLEILKEKATLLESEYDNLSDLNDDCTDLGADDGEHYMQETTSLFEECMKSYYALAKAEKGKSLMQEASPFKNSIDRDLIRIDTVMNRIHGTLGKGQDQVSDSVILEISENKELMSSILNTLLANVVEVSKLIEDIELTKKISDLTVKVDQLHTDSNVFIKRHKPKEEPLEESKTPITTGTDTPSSTSSQLDPKADEFKLTSSSIDFTTSVVTAGLTRLSTQLDSSSVASGSSSVISNTQGSSRTCSPTLMSHLNVNSTVAVSRPSQAASFHISDSVVSSTSGSILADPLTSISQYSVSSFRSNPEQVSSHDQLHDTVHTKRPTLPIFSGNRADWPEFRVVWKSLAESQFKGKLQLAMELKRCCRGNAAERVKHIYVTHERAYENLWSRLEEEYDDAGLCVQTALDQLVSLKPVGMGDHRNLVKFVDTIEGIHNQLEELHQLDAVHTADIDRTNRLLPRDVSIGWLRLYRDLTQDEKLKPFPAFMKFLRAERAIVARLVEYSPPYNKRDKITDPRKVGTHSSEYKERNLHYKKPTLNGCALHKGAAHPTESCRKFLQMSIKERYEALKEERRCFKCFKAHLITECTAKSCTCGKDHHQLLCGNPKKSSENPP